MGRDEGDAEGDGAMKMPPMSDEVRALNKHIGVKVAGPNKVKSPKRSGLEMRLELLLRYLDAPPWEPEHPIVAGRDFRADFAWPDAMVLIEVQGGVDNWNQKSGHNTPTGLKRDYAKSNAAQMAGWVYIQLAPHALTVQDVQPIVEFIRGRL